MAVVIATGRLLLHISDVNARIEHANEIFNQWVTVYVPQGVTSGEKPPSSSEAHTLLYSPHFPRLAFVRACFQSDSMMNRKWIWGIVKQFDALWRDYPTNSMQEKMFYHKYQFNL